MISSLFWSGSFSVRFTFYVRDDRGFILKILFDQEIKVPETGHNTYQQQNKREIRFCSECPIQPDAEEEATEDGKDHGNAYAAGIGHLNRRLSDLLIHPTPRNTIEK